MFVGEREDLGDFKPTILIGSLYKLIVKVLINRLKKVWKRTFLASKMTLRRGQNFRYGFYC